MRHRQGPERRTRRRSGPRSRSRRRRFLRQIVRRLARPDHHRHPVGAGELLLEPDEPFAVRRQRRAFDDDLRRRNDPRGEALARVTLGHVRLGVLRQPADQREPEFVSRSPLAATASTPSVTSTIRAATGLFVATRAARARSVTGFCSSSRASRMAVGPDGSGGEGQNATRPSTASSAGTRVIDTARPTNAASARPGPNARKNSSSPASSEAAPSDTIRPAVTTTGSTRTVAPSVGLQTRVTGLEARPHP